SQEVSRSGESEDVVPHVITGLIPLDQKSFLARLRMAWKGAIGESEPGDRPRLVHDVNDAASIQPPQAKNPSDDRYNLPSTDRCIRWTCFDPAEVEMLPPLQSDFRRLEHALSFTQFDPSVVNNIASRRHGSGIPDHRVGQFES